MYQHIYNSFNHDLLEQISITEYNDIGIISNKSNKSYEYDAIGNPTKITHRDMMSGAVLNTVNMTWKRGRELASYSDGAVSNTYQYNDAGLRTEKKMKDGSRIEYFYNGDLLEYELFFSASGTLTRLHKYIYNAEGNIEFLISKTDKFNNPNLYNAYSYIRNAQNDVVALVRVIRDTGTKLETGRELVATYTYSPYGELIESASHGFDSQTHLYNPFRYRGYYYDRETGLYYLQSRYYDAKTGRFLNGDDLSVLDEDQDSLIENNLFAYCLNNPVNHEDDEGRIAAVITGAAAVGGANLWNPVGWVILGAATVGVIGFYAYNIYKGNFRFQTKSAKKNKTKSKSSELKKIKNKVSNKIKTKSGKVDLGKFNRKGPKAPKGGRYILGPLGYKIIKDIDSHSGGVWKLFDRAGNRMATLLKDGTIIGK